MPLPASFARDGFLSLESRAKFRRLMIGSDGEANTGKTEFILSCPGPGIIICLDRGFDGMLLNQNPPPTRRNDYAFKPVSVPLATQAAQPEYLAYWRSFYAEYKKALDNQDARTVGLDGDSDSWELQRLAEFGKLTQIPPIMYTNVNAARRAMIARAWDTGKIIVATNKVKAIYKTVLNPDGTPKLNKNGEEVRERTSELERQGFSDQSYLWQLQIRHLYKEAKVNPFTKKETPEQWGLRITMCKADRSLEGTELWGSDCNFTGLVQTVYPHIPLKEWGLC